MKALTTSASKFHFDVLTVDGPVLVDFYADWCSMCRHLSPVLDEIASAWGDHLKVVKVDVEKHSTLLQRFAIRKVPTLILFDHGDELLRLVEVVRRPPIEACQSCARTAPHGDSQRACSRFAALSGNWQPSPGFMRPPPS
jgi:thioredoxin 1